MSNISLCVIYPSGKVINGVKQKRIYRIADYNSEYGEYRPYDPSEEKEFNPSYLMSPPDYSPEWYSAVFRRWEIDSSIDRQKTKSYNYSGPVFYELCFELERYNGSEQLIQQAFKEGLKLHAGIADNILFVLSRDEKAYRVVYCHKREFKEINGKYYLTGRISDLIHTTHYLPEHYIYYEDIFDISPYFYIKENSYDSYFNRTFYCYDKLPEAEDRFFLYNIKDYIPYFVARFLRSNKNQHFSKSDSQKVEKAIKEAFNSDEEIDAFFSLTGYSLSAVKEELAKQESTIISSISGSDVINDVVSSQLQRDESFRELIYTQVKNDWLAEADETRTKVNTDIQESREKLDSLKADAEELAENNKRVESRTILIEQQAENIVAEFTKAREQFDEEIAETIKRYHLLKNIGAIGSSTSNNTDIDGRCVNGHIIKGSNAHKEISVDSVNKHIKVLSRNFTNIGIKAAYAEAIAKSIAGYRNLFSSIIIAGFYARSFANAISAATEGENAYLISVSRGSAPEGAIRAEIEKAPTRTILIENIIDSFNEMALISLIKDYPEKMFVFSYESEEALAYLSKSVWNYCYFINADLLFGDIKEDFTLLYAKASEPISYYDNAENYTDTYEIGRLMKLLQLPSIAIMKNMNLMNSLISNFEAEEPSIITSCQYYLYSNIAKWIMMYSGSLSEEDVEAVKNALPSDLDN